MQFAVHELHYIAMQGFDCNKHFSMQLTAAVDLSCSGLQCVSYILNV